MERLCEKQVCVTKLNWSWNSWTVDENSYIIMVKWEKAIFSIERKEKPLLIADETLKIVNNGWEAKAKK